jgi:hypothetical protein
MVEKVNEVLKELSEMEQTVNVRSSIVFGERFRNSLNSIGPKLPPPGLTPDNEPEEIEVNEPIVVDPNALKNLN